MRVLVVGAGPAGLSFATLLARADRAHDITVIERNPASEDPGWGITLRANALSFLDLNKVLSPQSLEGRAFWHRKELVLDLPYPATVGNTAVSRTALLGALVGLCSSAGARLSFSTDGAGLLEADLAGYDLVVAADGANSTIRRMFADVFRPTVAAGRNRYSWLAAETAFHKLTVMLEDEEWPMLAWGYKHTGALSTFIVETTRETVEAAGLAGPDALRVIGRVFERALGGAVVLSRGPVRWHSFSDLSCERLCHKNVVLLGDAAHTTHFSQGYGTMFAFDDALALHDALAVSGSVPEALERYESVQKPKIASLQTTARTSMRWAESIVEAAAARDDAKERALIAARWPNNEVAPAPLASIGTSAPPRRPLSDKLAWLGLEDAYLPVDRVDAAEGEAG